MAKLDQLRNTQHYTIPDDNAPLQTRPVTPPSPAASRSGANPNTQFRQQSKRSKLTTIIPTHNMR